jgi:hypothetical protein
VQDERIVERLFLGSSAREDGRECLPLCLKQCQGHLIASFKKAAEKAAETSKQECMEDPAASKQLKAIANATVSLFRLEAQASACKQEWKWDGIKAVAGAMDNCDSGVKRETHQALAEMLRSFVENSPENAEGLITSSAMKKLLPYVETPEQYDVPQDMLVHCFVVLEACLKSGKSFAQKDDVQRALEKSRPAVQKSVSLA